MPLTQSEALSWMIGEVRIRRVEERVTAVPHGSLLPKRIVPLVETERPWIDPFVASDGRVLLSIHSFVVESSGCVLVVDTCVGDVGDRPLPNDPTFLDRLASEIDGGLAAVDVVLCTHLHFDHVGWNTRRDEVTGELVPTFPNARYLVAATELASLDNSDDHDVGNGVLTASIEPIRAAGQLEAVALNHRITPEVRLVSTPGHTPGHVSVLIESGGESALITGDVVHNPVQFTHPDITAERFDDDSRLATQTRRGLIEKYRGTSTVLLGTHFPPPTSGYLVSHNDAVRFEPVLGDRPRTTTNKATHEST